MDEDLALKENISRMPDEQLIEMVTSKPGEYREAALYFAKRELAARRIDFTSAEAAEPAAEIDDPPAGLEAVKPLLDSRGFVRQCLACGGPLRYGTLVAEKELTIIFSDNEEERFVRVNACSQCGNLAMTVDYDVDVQK